jgi:hypothetical protein
MKKLLCLSAVSIILFFNTAVKPSSAVSPSSSGLSVSPAITQASLTSNQTYLTLNETVTNISPIPLVINVHPQDFGSIGGTGTINFLSSTSYNPADNPHGLQNSVQLFSQKFTLAPGASYTEQINILGTESLAPGGHYGAIEYTPTAVVGVNNTKISTTPSVASLIFLTTAGGGTQNLHLNNILQSKLSFSLPKMTSFIMANSGNTQSTPIGYVSLSGLGHNLVAQAILNHNSLLVLPSSSILMSTSIPTHSTFLTLPGIYTLKFVYGYTGSSKLTTVSKSFLYINLFLIAFLIIVLIALVLVIRLLIRKHRRMKKNR